MSHPKLPLDGGCRCGKVRFRIIAPPLLTMVCHCKGCQRMTASAYSLSAAIPTDGFSLTQGDPVIGGLHDPTLRHYCCGYCMSWLFTKPAALDWFVNVRATMFDDTSWFVPFLETCASEKLPWVTTPATHSYPVFPTIDEYTELTAQYAAQA